MGIIAPMRWMLELLSKINYEPFPVENNPYLLNELWKQNITFTSDTPPLTQYQPPISRILLNKKFGIFMYFNKYFERKTNGFTYSFHQTWCLHMLCFKVKISILASMKNFQITFRLSFEMLGCREKETIKIYPIFPCGIEEFTEQWVRTTNSQKSSQIVMTPILLL